jgi:hypothetical protein
MPLTQDQLEMMNVLEWLFSNNSRRTGRTTALAVAAIRQACRNPGQQIILFDHASGNMTDMRRIMRNLIESFVNTDGRLRPFLQIRNSMFQLNLPEPIQDWVPPEFDERMGYVGMFEFSPSQQGRDPADPVAIRMGGLIPSLWSPNVIVSHIPMDPTPPVERRSVWERLMDED